jgi:hypothetical protein
LRSEKIGEITIVWSPEAIEDLVSLHGVGPTGFDFAPAANVTFSVSLAQPFPA